MAGTAARWWALCRSRSSWSGLGLICLGGYLGLLALWKGQPRTIVADIGLRLVSTGYVIAVFAGMADVFGMGSQPLPGVPYFGPWQATGVLIGEVLIAHWLPDADSVSHGWHRPGSSPSEHGSSASRIAANERTRQTWRVLNCVVPPWRFELQF